MDLSSTILVNDSIQLLRHLHEKGTSAIHVRHKLIQFEGEQLGLGERCMELSGMTSFGRTKKCVVGLLLDSPIPGSNSSSYRRCWLCSNDHH